MNDKQLEILDNIVELDGNCLDHNLCIECPFRKKCLPEFVIGKPLSKKQRLSSALDVIARKIILNDGS